MPLSVLYFAWVREGVGTGQEQVDPPEAVRNVADLICWLAGRSPGHAEALRDPAKLRAALDQRFVPLDALLGDAREVALFPPVTGG
jgi:molybdopterin synthase sulfur carrier subunit